MFAVLACAAITGCGGAATAPNNGDVGYSTSVAPAVFHQGEAVTVTVTVANISTRPVAIDTVPCGYDFVVTAGSGAPVGPEPSGCFSAADKVVVLFPGEAHAFRQSWRGSGLTPSPGGGAMALPPGSYKVEAAADVPSSLNPGTSIEILP